MARITEVAGWDAAVKVVGYWGGRTMYVPDSMGPDHELAAVIGYEPALCLVAEYGGQTLAVPAMSSSIDSYRRAGLAKALKRYEVPNRLIALALKVSEKRVEQMVGKPQNEQQAGLM